MSAPAVVFPGQGSQYVGMSRSFYDGFPSAKDAFEEASDVLGFDVARLCFEGPAGELDRTENTQPALLVAGMAAWRALEERFEVNPGCMAGHSLGEYTALVASGAMDFADAVRVVRLRGRYMQESVPAGAGSMCAILGLPPELVDEVCAEASTDQARVVPANINSPQQIVVSGAASAVEKAAALAEEAGAKRVVTLQVSAPSHSPLMAPAAAKLAEELEGVEVSPPGVPVYSNVSASPVDAGSIKDLLSKQLTSPVRWVDIIRNMKSTGVDKVLEVGPGKVLTGLNKRIERSMECANVDKAGDFEKASGFFAAKTSV